MSDHHNRVWFFYVNDMIGFTEKVLTYTHGYTQEEFIESGLTYDATLRNLELIGEAATHIPDDVRTAYPEIAWRAIIAMRNRIIHGYLGVDNDTIWSIIQNDIPKLWESLQNMYKQS